MALPPSILPSAASSRWPCALLGDHFRCLLTPKPPPISHSTVMSPPPAACDTVDSLPETLIQLGSSSHFSSRRSLLPSHHEVLVSWGSVLALSLFSTHFHLIFGLIYTPVTPKYNLQPGPLPRLMSSCLLCVSTLTPNVQNATPDFPPDICLHWSFLSQRRLHPFRH